MYFSYKYFQQLFRDKRIESRGRNCIYNYNNIYRNINRIYNQNRTYKHSHCSHATFNLLYMNTTKSQEYFKIN